MPETNNLAQFFVDLISGLGENVAAPILEATAEADVPFLALPIVKQIFEYVVSNLIDKIDILVEDGVIQIVFKAEAAEHEMALANALLALKNAHATGDPNNVNQALQNAVAAWQQALTFGGIAPTH